MVEPKVGDLFIVRYRSMPWRVDGPVEVTFVGRKFFYLGWNGRLKCRLEDGKSTFRGVTIESYEPEVHGAIVETSELIRWWTSMELNWLPSVNKLRAMKAAYDKVVEFEGPDPGDDDE